MAVKDFKFISPGTQIHEIDNTNVPNAPGREGPVIIGRAERGPGMRPVIVQSYEDFVNLFGNPIAGGQGGDVWRDGNKLGPVYGGFAAEAYLTNNSPITYVRLLGTEHENRATAGKAGWQTAVVDQVEDTASNGGAFGLFIVNSGTLTTNADQTGALAAIFYLDEGSIALSGTQRGGIATVKAAALIESIGNSATFGVEIRNARDVLVKRTRCNFNPNSQLYARDVFNTNPTLTNSDITPSANDETYWLGETFERHLQTHVNVDAKCFGVILALASGSVYGSDFRMGTQPARSGWFFSQDLTTNHLSYDALNMTRLFRFHAINSGDYEAKHFKVSITDIRPSPTPEYDKYGTFTVIIRQSSDSDNASKSVEKFANCTLNPNSNNYIAKKIGDRYVTWDDTERRYREYGNYPNLSKFIRLEMNVNVDNGATDPLFLPFGVLGPPRFSSFGIFSGSASPGLGNTPTYTAHGNAFVQGSGSLPHGPTGSNGFVKVDVGGLLAFTSSFEFPKLTQRSSSFDGNLANPQDAYWGLDSTRTGGSTQFEWSYLDSVLAKPSGVDSYAPDLLTTEYSYIFTLDDLRPATVGSQVGAQWISGSRLGATSFTAVSSSWSASLDLGFNKFTAPLFGGFDGLDITEIDPFRNSSMTSTSTELNSYVYNSIKRAIDSVSDPEPITFNLATIPGLTHDSLTEHLINVCEDRGDALAIIDLDGDYEPNHESTAEVVGDVTNTITNLKSRGINSSYGCAYYPWIRIRDKYSGTSLWCPPSVVALGTMASTERHSELWWAPAGFNRGGLSEGVSGLPVIGIRERLTQKERDSLYGANINPIASFPNEGIVIFGQKTLQTSRSALNRISIRRLINHVKRQISLMSKNILFEPNVQATWNRFISQAQPFLDEIKIKYGLEDFRIILDETTTTPDLIDQNIMYGKIILKPTRTIEFIAIDVSLENIGASFTD